MMWYYGVNGWAWFWMSVMMVLFWGGVVVLAVWAIRSVAGPGPHGDAALDVLRKRLAAGEITPEDYEKARKTIGA